MATFPIRLLVVDDYEPWLRFVRITSENHPGLQIVGEASDGFEAIRKSQELQPELILLDVGLPKLNGIEAARRIRAHSPNVPIVFCSEHRSADIAKEALSTGAGGYIVKSDAGRELIPAIEAVLEGKRFVSASLASHDLVEAAADHAGGPRQNIIAPFSRQQDPRHDVEFYEDDVSFVDGFARFIESALSVGNSVIVVATESHQASVFRHLLADGVDVAAEIKQGRYIPLDVMNTLSRFMVNGSPDPVLFRKLAGELMMKACRAAKGEHPRVAVCGEGVHVLLAEGNLEGTIELERMWNEIAKSYHVDILCGYFQSVFEREENRTLERICVEHSAVHG